MIAAALLPLALAGAQDASAAVADPEAFEDEEIVVRATVGRVALLFDQAPDGKLINCRVYISSGVDAIDEEACDTLPDCSEDGPGSTVCERMTERELALEPRRSATEPSVRIETLPTQRLVLPPKPSPMAGTGPMTASSTSEDDPDPNRLTRLPPPPRDTTAEPVVAVTLNGGDER